jgi:hypothetical protein
MRLEGEFLDMSGMFDVGSYLGLGRARSFNQEPRQSDTGVLRQSRQSLASRAANSFSMSM